MNKEKKIEQLLDSAIQDDLTEYKALVKRMGSKLPFFGRKTRIAAALLKDTLGDISKLDLSLDFMVKKESSGKIVFEDIKDGRVRLFINIGKNHGLNPGDLIREIVKRSGLDGKQVGKIDIHSTYSFLEVPEQYGELVILSFENIKFKGVSIVVEPAKKKKKDSR
jgi:hypothetical protein